jgi:hypothetical protein
MKSSWISPMSMWCNLLSYGLNFKASTLSKKLRMISLGVSHLMDNTPRLRLIRHNFFGAISTSMNKMLWKVWEPPKTNSLAWSALKNRLWTVGRLEKRGWPNCGLYPLCKTTTESEAHLVASPQEFGPSLKIGLESLRLTHMSEKCTPSMFGGFT